MIDFSIIFCALSNYVSIVYNVVFENIVDVVRSGTVLIVIDKINIFDIVYNIVDVNDI